MARCQRECECARVLRWRCSRVYLTSRERLALAHASQRSARRGARAAHRSGGRHRRAHRAGPRRGRGQVERLRGRGRRQGVRHDQVPQGAPGRDRAGHHHQECRH